MNETLTPKQDSFCVHYTTIGAETFSNGTKSAIAAGYSEKGAYARGSELLRLRKVLERICELHTENMQRNMITVDKVLADLEHDKLMARQAGQYSVSYQCTVAQGKYLSMFTDNVRQSGEGLSITFNSPGQAPGSRSVPSKEAALLAPGLKVDRPALMLKLDGACGSTATLDANTDIVKAESPPVESEDKINENEAEKTG